MGSCNRKAIYSHYDHTDIREGWDRGDTLEYLIPKMGKEGMYSEEVGLRTTTAYPFTSLTMIVKQQAFPSGFSRSDTVTISLTDSVGNRLGNGIMLYQNNCQLPDVQLSGEDSLKILISHYMKRESLRGISDIGVTIRQK
jgi:gliding motility-associated lipoprotein GldH